MSYKSRMNWWVKWSDNQYEKIFGERKKSESKIVKTKTISDICRPIDCPNGKEIVKIGKEINRMTQLGEKHKHKELEGEVNKRLERQVDRELAKRITNDIVMQLRAK